VYDENRDYHDTLNEVSALADIVEKWWSNQFLFNTYRHDLERILNCIRSKLKWGFKTMISKYEGNNTFLTSTGGHVSVKIYYGGNT
jgi:uncharacterized protein (UPF0128 family)